jgi:general L-amino acid transport system ATP-binding protein
MSGHAESSDIITCTDVNKWYGDFHALRGVSLTVRRGVVVIIGPSGSGKSTFIRCHQPAGGAPEGDIIVDGIALTPRCAQHREDPHARPAWSSSSSTSFPT